jgi:fructose-specific phosphotransferase system component IIB
MSEAEMEEFDEVDELLIAEGVMTKEEIRESKKRAEEWDIEEMIDNPDRVLEEADEEDSDDTKPYDPTDEFDDE